MDTKHLIAVEKWTCVLGALVIGTAILFLGRHAAFGVTVGAGLMVLNALALRRIGQRACPTSKRPGAAILLFNAKMAVVLALVYVILRYVRVDPIAFIVGISILPVAIVIVAIRHMFRHESETESKPNG
jgi:hypothetical protein